MSRLDWLPRPVAALLRHYRHAPRLNAQRRTLGARVQGAPTKIIIGSSGTRMPGWIHTDREVLDLLREDTWSRWFQPSSIDAILAEHVWEHLTPDGAAQGARLCFRYLKPGGYLRVAVPDGLHPDPAYVDAVRPGGGGPGSDDHKLLYTYESFSQLFTAAGFEVELLEYFDAQGAFHARDWDPAAGMIQRSRRFDPRNAPGRLSYTSVLLDARKPAR